LRLPCSLDAGHASHTIHIHLQSIVRTVIDSRGDPSVFCHLAAQCRTASIRHNKEQQRAKQASMQTRTAHGSLHPPHQLARTPGAGSKLIHRHLSGPHAPAPRCQRPQSAADEGLAVAPRSLACLPPSGRRQSIPSRMEAEAANTKRIDRAR